MLITIPDILTAEEVNTFRQKLDASDAWVDGRVSAGYQGAAVKQNEQITELSPIARELGGALLSKLERHPLFISAALPNHVYPPMFNRYANGMHFGNHVDGAVRLLPGSAAKLRTDISATLFLSAPTEYDGGELRIEDTSGSQAIKLPAGHLVLYPSTSVHSVTSITRGTRVASFFWIESLIRYDAQRTILFELDTAIQKLNATGADQSASVKLTGCYHNLLRMWSNP